MTQPQYGYPPQGYPQPDPYAQQGYGQAPQYPQQQYPPQGYAPANPYGQPMPYAQAPQYGPPPGPPPQDLSGDLESFYSQRNVSGGKGLSWKGVPDGYTVFGVVARPITNGDVFKETHPPNSPQAGQVRVNRDGSPKYAMQVPLKLLVPLQGYEDSEARLFLRGQLRDEVTRAMAEVGAPEGPPESGAFMRITLTHRKPSQNIAQNIFAVLYRSPGTWENDPGLLQQQIQHTAPSTYYPPPQPAPAGQVYGGAPQGPYQQPPAQYAAAQAAPNPQQYAQPQAPAQGAPQYGGQAYDPNQYTANPGYAPNQGMQQAPQDQGAQQPQGQPVNPSQGPAQWQQPAPNPQAPVNQGPAPYQPAAQPQGQPVQDQLPYGGQQAPAGATNPNAAPVQAGVQQSALDPRRQELLARLQGQQQGQAGAAPQQPQG